MTRSGLLFAWLVIALAAGLLTAESLVPGNALLPLMPDDFPAWREGRPGDVDLARHPAPNWSMSDVDHLLIPGLATTRRSLERGELPLWDPTQALGVPHLAEVHYSVLYPPAWIPLLVGTKGLGLLAWVHLMLAGAGMLLYLRSLQRSAGAALVGALAFALSAWITARLHSFPAVGAAVWLPWVLWGLELGALSGRARCYVAAGAALGLSFLAGFPQVAMLVAGVAGWMELARMLSRPKHALKTGSAALGALALALALAAPQLLPTWDYMHELSARTESDDAALASQALEPELLTHLVAPDYLASSAVTGLHPLALMHLDGAVLPALNNRPEVSMGIGVLGLLLALLAMLFGRQWSTRAWTLLVLLVFALLLYPPLLLAASRLLPILRYGDPRRLLLLSTAGLAVLAAGGVDVVARGQLRVTVVSWAAAVSLTAWSLWLLLGVPSAGTQEDLDSWALQLAHGFGLETETPADVFEGIPIPIENFSQAASSSGGSALVALVVALVCVILFRPRSEATERGWTSLVRRAPDILALVLAAELLFSAFPLLRAAHVAGAIRDPYSLKLPVPPVVAAIHAVVNEARGESLVPPRVLRHGNDPPWLRPNFPGCFGLTDIQAYAPMVPRRTQELLSSISPGTAISGSHVGGFSSAEELQSPLVDLLGVDVVLTSDAALEVAGMSQASQVGALRVLVNAEAHPHAWFATDLLVSPPTELGPGAWVDPAAGFDPILSVALEQEPPLGPVPAGSLPSPEGAAFGARVVRVAAWSPGALTLELGAGPAGALVVAEGYHHGWEALVDGQPAPVLVADHAILAVPVAEGGTARVELRYREPLLLLGGLAGAGGLLSAVMLLYWSSRRLRRAQESP
ncbi:MAG: hypothetical protein DRQ55_11290 [Planctomycetota bacterium]|nr:MAG: hypothetical protein DRQ55_11290 [Planctomycetota bacterium]